MSYLLTVKGSIGGHEINMLVDTGSGVTLIWEDVWIQIHAKTLVTLQPVLGSVVTASGEKLKNKCQDNHRGSNIIWFWWHSS